MEMDTGASISIISKTAYETIKKESACRDELQQSEVKLKTYTGEPIQVLGMYLSRSAIITVL